MSDKLKEGLSELLTMLTEALKKGGEFAVEQAPLVVQEFLNWGIAIGTMQIILGIVLFVIGFWITYKLFNDWKNEGAQPASIFSVPLAGAGVITFCTGIYKLVYIIVAPRVYLIEQISNFL